MSHSTPHRKMRRNTGTGAATTIGLSPTAVYRYRARGSMPEETVQRLTVVTGRTPRDILKLVLGDSSSYALEPPPCTGCEYEPTCRRAAVACRAFASWVSAGHTHHKPTIPNSTHYYQLFGSEDEPLDRGPGRPRKVQSA